MAVAFVKNVGSVNQGGGGSTTLTITVPAGGVAANNSIILRLVELSTATALNSVADSRGGNTWASKVGPQNASTTGREWIYEGTIAVALQAGDTITATFAAKIQGHAIADEFSGVSATTDGTNLGSGTDATPTTGAIVPTGATDLIFGTVWATANPGTFTADADNAGGDTWHELTTIQFNRGAYKITTSAVSQTYNPTWVNSVLWTALIVALNASASGTTYTKAGFATENRVA